MQKYNCKTTYHCNVCGKGYEEKEVRDISTKFACRSVKCTNCSKGVIVSNNGNVIVKDNITCKVYEFKFLGIKYIITAKTLRQAKSFFWHIVRNDEYPRYNHAQLRLAELYEKDKTIDLRKEYERLIEAGFHPNLPLNDYEVHYVKKRQLNKRTLPVTNIDGDRTEHVSIKDLVLKEKEFPALIYATIGSPLPPAIGMKLSELLAKGE